MPRSHFPHENAFCDSCAANSLFIFHFSPAKITEYLLEKSRVIYQATWVWSDWAPMLMNITLHGDMYENFRHNKNRLQKMTTLFCEWWQTPSFKGWRGGWGCNLITVKWLLLILSWWAYCLCMYFWMKCTRSRSKHVYNCNGVTVNNRLVKYMWCQHLCRGEQNFHIFYYIHDGLVSHEHEKDFHLQQNTTYRCQFMPW